MTRNFFNNFNSIIEMQRRDFFRNAAAGALGLGAHSILNAAPDIEKTGIADTYDVVVIGGGTAGTIAAIQAGRLGAKTLVIEIGRAHV